MASADSNSELWAFNQSTDTRDSTLETAEPRARGSNDPEQARIPIAPALDPIPVAAPILAPIPGVAAKKSQSSWQQHQIEYHNLQGNEHTVWTSR